MARSGTQNGTQILTMAWDWAERRQHLERLFLSYAGPVVTGCDASKFPFGFLNRRSCISRQCRLLGGSAGGSPPSELEKVNYFSCLHGDLAERGRFELPIELPLCRISSAVHSTTLPPLQAHDGDGIGPCGRAVF